MTPRRKITIMTPCFNEEGNVSNCYEAVKAVFADELRDYDYEHIFIDNSSADRTVEILRGICAQDKNVRVIVNSRNFGPHRSPFYGLLQMSGDAVIPIMADLQTPVRYIGEFVRKWQEGFPIVIGVRKSMREGPLMEFLRSAYYRFLSAVAESEHIRNFIGFGLYDRKVMDIIRDMGDNMPYFRGLIGEIGFDRFVIEYDQPARKVGRSKQRWSDLLDYAVVGLTYSSRLPLRLVTVVGILIAGISLLMGITYLTLKLMFWDTFDLGLAPMLIGVFFLGSIQIIFLGFVAEYVGMTFERVRNRPIVIERERINFD
ncbi:MAG: glycosyltransferase family 2 protein [Hyphomicrobium sp.]